MSENNLVSQKNQRSLVRLSRAIAFSQGQFSLVFVRCNYSQLRGKMLQQLQTETLPQLYPNLGQIQSLVLPSITNRLYETIQGYLGTQKQPSALMVLGLELNPDLKNLLTSTNLVRDEFRKQLKFPLILWINHTVLQKIMKLAPDFYSFAANPIEFNYSREELQDLIRQKANFLFDRILNYDQSISAIKNSEDSNSCSFEITQKMNRIEMESASQELKNLEIVLEPELNASLQFVFGQDDFSNNAIASAIARYQESLRVWRNLGQLERQAILLFHLGLCYARLGERRVNNSSETWEEAWIYCSQSLKIFEQSGRQDLVAQIIGLVAEILQRLKAKESLIEITEKSLRLHQIYGSQIDLAIDYGFLSKQALNEQRWELALQQGEKALEILEVHSETEIEATPLQPHPYSFYKALWKQSFQLFVVKALRGLSRFTEASQVLEIASQELDSALELSEYRYDPYRYLRLLKGLRSLYFDESRYREAFWIKKQQRSIEQQYGLRPFIGAGQLLPKRQAINPSLSSLSVISSPAYSGKIPEAISTSNRQQDIEKLIYRISRPDYKLTVIHGPSGVGKSSLVTAGLVPALQATPIGAQIAIPVVLRVYTNWIYALGHHLTQALKETQGVFLDEPLKSIPTLLQQLKANEERNLLTVLIFDQFEEFFFSVENLTQRREFYQFFEACLKQPSIKLIISIREDYLSHLLEFEKYIDLEETDSNPTDKHNRYALSNFSQENTAKIIKNLTHQAHFYLEEQLIQALVSDLAGERGEVRPIELQIVGAQLQTENITTLEQYRRAGSVQRLVERYVQEVIRDCGAENEKQARRVLYLLTDEHDTRPLKTRADLAVDLGNNLSQLDLILEIFVDSGLVTLIPESPAHRYQLVHDYLVGIIREKEQLNLVKERQEFRDRYHQNQEEINELLKQNELLAELAEARYKLVKEDIETFISQPLKSGTLAEIVAARKREEISQVVIEQLRQEKSLLADLAEAKQKRRESEKQFKQMLIAGICTLATLTAIAGYQGRQAIISEIRALSASSVARFASNQEIEAVSDSLRAVDKLKMPLLFAGQDIYNQVSTGLQQAVYQIREQNRLESHTDGVYSVSFSANGSLIATASADRTIKLWNWRGKLLTTLTGHDDRVSSVAFSPDHQILASASWDTTVKLWNLRNYRLITTLVGHQDTVSAVSFSPNNQYLATASVDRTVKIWRRDGMLLATLRGHTAPITSISWQNDSQAIATAGLDNHIKLWRRDGTLIKTFDRQNGHTAPIENISFSPDNQLLASVSDDNTLKLWTATGQYLRTIEAHNETIYGVAWSPDNHTLATSSQDNTVKLWTRQGTLLTTLRGHRDWVSSVSFSPDGNVLASASRDKTVKLWSFDNSLLIQLRRQPTAINGVSLSADQRWIATAQKNNIIQLWRRDRSLPIPLAGHTDAVWSVNFSPDSQTLISASADKTLRLWTVQGQLLKTFTGHRESILSATFSPNGKQIASASRDQTVRLWNPQGKLLYTLTGHNQPVNWVSFSPDSQLLASASEDKTVKLWTIQGQWVATLKGHTEGVWGVTWSPDGQFLATASPDKTVKIWTRQGQLYATLMGHTETVSTVAWSPDDQFIASAGNDKTVKLWNRQGRLLHTLSGHPDIITNVSFSPDSRILAVAVADGNVLLWDLAHLSLDQLQSQGCRWLDDYLRNRNQADDLGC